MDPQGERVMQSLPSFPGGIWVPPDPPAPVIPPEAVEPVGAVVEPVAPVPERYAALNALKRRAAGLSQ